MKAYIAGPMRGMPDLNFPAFHEAEKRLRELGWDVYNPAQEDDADPAQPLQYYLRRDLRNLVDCDLIVLLAGWESSEGACKEMTAAHWAGLKAYLLEDDGLTPIEFESESVLQEAGRLINGPRQADYSHPLDDFMTTGRMWGAILGIPDVTPENVGLCMVAVKLSRESRRHKRDNLVDMAGYAGCIENIHDERERRNHAIEEG